MAMILLSTAGKTGGKNPTGSKVMAVLINMHIMHICGKT